jgi:short-subunit dehydrogenase
MDNQKVILVTGCSSGFGLLTVVRLAAQGHFVWATMRDLNKRKTLEKELDRRNILAFIRELDVTKPASIKKVVDEIQKTHFHIDVLINNAGFGIAGFFEDLKEEEIRAQMDVNFFGVQNVCRQVIPVMRARSRGKIINISSIAGQVSTPCLGAYNASKWALEGFSESLYHELAMFGISVVLVEPGLYPTEIFTSNAQYAANFDNAQSPYFPFSQKLKNVTMENLRKIKRDPDDVARIIEKIINDPHPRLRYVSDFSSWSRIVIQKMMPPHLFGSIFRRLAYADK